MKFTNQLVITGIVRKGGSQGAGSIKIPKNDQLKLKTGYRYKFLIRKKSVHQKPAVQILSTLKKIDNSHGFYIPKDIMNDFQLANEEVEISIERTKMFKAKISSDKRIIIPTDVVKEYQIKGDLIYEIKISLFEISPSNSPKSDWINEYVRISELDRSKSNRTNEFSFIIRQNIIRSNKDAEILIIRQIPFVNFNWIIHKKRLNIPSFFPEKVQIGQILSNRIIIFSGQCQPVICPITIDLTKISHFMGCFYADGTKSGSGWSINASTVEQAQYYLDSYKKIIYNPELCYDLTYTKKRNDISTEPEIKFRLQSFWNSQIYCLNLRLDRIHIIEGLSDNPLKFNEYGSLRIRDNRGTVRECFIFLMNRAIQYNIETHNLIGMKNFIMGVAEGDACAGGGQARLSLSISTNRDDYAIRPMLNSLGISYYYNDYIIKNQLGNGISININTLEILKDLAFYQANLFIFYPKRRKIFFERFLTKPTVQYILGNSDYINPDQAIEIKKISENPNTRKLLFKIQNELKN